jgi:hypothetical protein
MCHAAWMDTIDQFDDPAIVVLLVVKLIANSDPYKATVMLI